jgi:hypothetical protein
VNSAASILIRLISLDEVAQACRRILSDRNSVGVVSIGSIQQDPVFQRSGTKLDAIPGGEACLVAFDQIAARALQIQTAGVEAHIIVADYIIVGGIEHYAAV